MDEEKANKEERGSSPERYQPIRAKYSEDRSIQCPIMIRVFVKEGNEHHSSKDFENENLPEDEVIIYAWMDSTLKEISDLIKLERDDLKDKSMSFAVVFNDLKTGKWHVGRPVGTVHPQRMSKYEYQNLRRVRFRPGCYLSLKVFTPTIRNHNSNSKIP